MDEGLYLTHLGGHPHHSYGGALMRPDALSYLLSLGRGLGVRASPRLHPWKRLRRFPRYAISLIEGMAVRLLRNPRFC